MPPYPQTYSSVLGQVDDSVRWRQLVRRYTRRKLTHGNDRLPAIAGIASLTPQARRTPYLAGLWLESIIVDLMWHVEPYSTGHERLAFPLQKDGQPVTAPSWSWASVRRAVLWDPLQDFRPLAQVVDHAISVKSQANPLGQVLLGALHIKGRVTSCRIQWDGHCHYVYRRRGQKLHFIADGSLVAHERPTNTNAQQLLREGCRVAMRQQGEDSTATWWKEDGWDAAVLCLGRTPLLHFGHVGLVIAPSSNSQGASERLGAIVRLGQDWWSEGIERTVMLV